MSSNIERKLAAIMFTDIADFTALSAKDENKALELLNQQSKILSPITSKFNGTLHKKIGDGLLYTFSTVTDAIKCAIQIQKETLKVKNLNIRIGIHQGEIALMEGDVLGDDVNVASRIEAFSPIGGISISGKVQQDISSLPEYITQFIGTPKLKGVSQDVKIYAITSHDLPSYDKSKVKLEHKTTKTKFNILALTGALLTIIGAMFWLGVGFFDLSYAEKYEIPSVGVMKMDNLGKEEDSFWVRGITEDLIIKVASSGNIRIPSMKEINLVDSNESWEKIAERLNVKYILTSSLYKDNEQFKLRSQLINTHTGVTEYANNWTESNEKSSLIVSTLANQMLKIISPSSKVKVDENIVNSESYALYLKAKSFIKDNSYADLSIDELTAIREMYENSISLDSTNIDAQIQLARSHWYHYNYDIAKTILEKSLKICEKTNQEKLLGRVYRNLGVVLGRMWRAGPGNYSDPVKSKGDNYTKKAAMLAKKHIDIYGYEVAMANIMVALTYYSKDIKNVSDSAHFYADQMIQFGKDNNNIQIEARAYKGLSNFYHYNDDLSESKYYARKAYQLSDNINNSLKMSILDDLYSLAYIDADYYEQLDYINKKYELALLTGNDSEIASSLFSKSLIFYFPFKDYDTCNELLNEALSFKKEIADFNWYERSIFMMKSKINSRKGEYTQALKNFNLSFEIFNKGPMSDFGIFGHNYNFGQIYFNLGEYQKAQSHLERAIVIMRVSNAVRDDMQLGIDYFLNEVMLGNITSASDIIINPLNISNPLNLDSKKSMLEMTIKDVLNGEEISLDQWIETNDQHYLTMQSHTRDYLSSDKIDIYYKSYLIYDALGHTENAEKYINLCYNEIMNVSKSLRTKDQKNFLNNSIDIVNVIKIWKELNNTLFTLLV